MGHLKNFLKKFLPPPVNAFNREMNVLDQRLLKIEEQMLEQQRQLLMEQQQWLQELDKKIEKQSLTFDKKLEQRTLALDKKLESLSKISGQLNQIKLAAKRTTPQPRLSYFEFSIVDHCNLRCQGCVHFSCIAEEHFVTVESIKRDLDRMSELLHGEVTRISVMGGEPLLHPDLQKILAVTRSSFPGSTVLLVTNGLLLLKMSVDFWECCRENNIVVSPTKYPINLDYEEIQRIADQHNVQFEFYGGTGNVQKTSWKLPLDLNGRQDPIYNFWTCYRSNFCVNLDNGKLYTCAIAPSIRIFNKKFGTHLELDSGDYLDIYKAQCADDIYNFLAKPKPFCRYCMISKQSFGLPWGLSKQKMSEWLPD